MCIACAWPSWAPVVLVASSTASLAPRAPTRNAVSFRDCPHPPRQLVLHPLIPICRHRAPDRLLGAGQCSRQSTRRRAEHTPTRSTSSRCSPRRSSPSIQATWRPCTSRTAPTRARSRPDGMLPPCRHLVPTPTLSPDRLAPCHRISCDLNGTTIGTFIEPKGAAASAAYNGVHTRARRSGAKVLSST